MNDPELTKANAVLVEENDALRRRVAELEKDTLEDLLEIHRCIAYEAGSLPHFSDRMKILEKAAAIERRILEGDYAPEVKG